MKICIISSNTGENGFGRAWILAKALKLRHEVLIVGTDWGSGIWPVVNLEGMEVRTVKGCWWPNYIKVMKETISLVEGDIIYAVKPKLSSYGIGLKSREKLKKPLILDIDDDEMAFTESVWKRWKLKKLRNPNAYLATKLMESWVDKADAKTVVSEYFQKKFNGGIIIPHGRDTDILNPMLYDGSAEKSARGFDNLELIVFLGTPRPHKSLEDILKAIRITGRGDLKLLIVGFDEKKSYSKKLRKLGENILLTVPPQPFSDLPHWLSMADLVVLPMTPGTRSAGQVPAKLIDAMAMGKPIIAADVGVMGQIVDDCAILTPPKDIERLAGAMEKLLDNKELARELGRKAREKCIEEYSLKVMSDRLEEVINSVVYQVKSKE